MKAQDGGKYESAKRPDVAVWPLHEVKLSRGLEKLEPWSQEERFEEHPRPSGRPSNGRQRKDIPPIVSENQYGGSTS